MAPQRMNRSVAGGQGRLSGVFMTSGMSVGVCWGLRGGEGRM